MKSSFNTSSVSLVAAGPPEDHEPCTSSYLKGDCLCEDQNKSSFYTLFLMLFLGMKKGRSLFTIVHKDLPEMEQLLRWLFCIY